MIDYKKLLENLGKLKRNEEKMTPAQKIRYAEPLMKLKKTIAEDTTSYIYGLMLLGLKAADQDEDWKDVVTRIEVIIGEEKEKGLFDEFSRILFSTYDLRKVEAAAAPLFLRVRYEAYGPYWISHCIPTFEKEITYQNDLIGRGWHEDLGIWTETKEENGHLEADRDGWVAFMLPPTPDLLAEEYKEQMEVIGK